MPYDMRVADSDTTKSDPLPVPGHRVRVDGVDWYELLPFVNLFASFRMALDPSKLILGLVLAVLLYLGGLGIDVLWGNRVVPGEFALYMSLPAEQYEQQVQRRTDRLMSTEMQGVFAKLLEQELTAFDQLVTSAANLDFGLRALLGDRFDAHAGVGGALATMVWHLPAWLYRSHPGFMAIYLAYAFLLTALLGGAIARIAAVEACSGKRIGPMAGLQFAGARYGWFVLAPAMPMILALLVGLLLALCGLVLFNAPVLDVIGGGIFGLLVLGGLVIAVLIVGLAFAGNLLYPALAVEAVDAFDAVSRAYNYVITRPWRFLFYTAVMLVYGAIGYLVVGLIVFAALSATRAFVGLGSFAELSDGVTRFDAIFPEPELTALSNDPHQAALDGSSFATLAAWLARAWVKLFILLLPAFAVSYYFSAQTWVYLLLRQAVDHVGFGHWHHEPDDVDQFADDTPNEDDSSEGIRGDDDRA